ncbi:ubiquinol-cytochrome c reductase cytochrome b subunit [Agromyces sp. Root81]|uniref:cytochrome bc1 complex cytochrome b subunit n=1 Tax=Agromyces sp. Root81 TaxID=1736601 RepID=UPI0006F305C0|nr:cytochrome b N-terminal domain-containing protein [Agromyces sp. Root81]KRC59159.1 ubiquinol-cytochrome c reductase cytochrome b subunit [Agromyces sp. Root81]
MSIGRKPRTDFTGRLSGRLAQTGIGRRGAAAMQELRRRVVPVHWSNMFGAVALACLAVITVTGVILMFHYTPSGASVAYEGRYPTLHGAQVSEAFASTMHISFEVPGGLALRQAHHWAALLLPAAVLAQLLVTFFTGAFRRPRRAGWVLLFLILIAALAGGWSGYALPDDMLSGTGLRIVEGITLGIPVVGTWMKDLLFGGQFPGEIIERLYPLHLAVVPLMLALIVVRVALLSRHQPAQFAGPRRTGANVVGMPLFPNAAARSGGLFLIVSGMLMLISATVTINPIWLYGPASPGDAGAGSQPDWYTGFLDGALRLVPPGWEIVAFDRTWTLAVLAPLAVISVFLLTVAVYPFIEERITGDHGEHHLLDRPRNTPTRTGTGVAGVVFSATLWAAGSADVMADAFSLTVEGVVLALQIVLVIGPLIGFALARRVCLGLQHKDRDLLLHGFETGRIVRLPGGEYVEVHEQLNPDERSRVSLAGVASVQDAGSTDGGSPVGSHLP